MRLCNDCYSQVKSVLEAPKIQFPPKRMRQDWLYQAKFSSLLISSIESLSKEQMLALRLIRHIPILVFGTVASLLCSWKFQSQLQS